MTTYTTPHNLPQLETTDLIKSPTGDNLRKQINALSAASNSALDAVKWDRGVNAADLNTVQSSGRWAVNSTTTANLPVAVAGTVHINWGSTTGTQTYVTREATPRVYHRAYLAGAWGAWTNPLTDAKAYADQQDYTKLVEAKTHADQQDVIHENNAVGRAVDDAAVRYGGLPDRMTAVESKNTAQDATLGNHESRVNDLEILGGLAPGDVSDATMHNILVDPASLSSVELGEQFTKKNDPTAEVSLGVLGIGDPATPAFYQARVTVPDGTARTALRIDQKNTVNTSDAVKIVNLAPAYGLKIDQLGATPFDTVNLNSPGGGAHTVLGVGGGNTTLSTVKITNMAAQTGGAVVAALGTDPARTAQIFGADNYGIGASFSAHQWNGANAPAFRAIYDAGYSHDARAIWIAANHTGGSIAYIENPSAQTSGQMVNLVQSNAGSTAPIIQITNAGTGDHFTAPNFAVTQGGNVKASALLNFSSFNNSRVQLTSLGTVVDRNVGDSAAALRVNNAHGSSTGDILQIQSGGTVRGRFTKAGHLAVRTNTAPSDADLVANEAALWFDPTNGAARIMWKAKQADGTIRTGALNLA